MSPGVSQSSTTSTPPTSSTSGTGAPPSRPCAWSCPTSTPLTRPNSSGKPRSPMSTASRSCPEPAPCARPSARPLHHRHFRRTPPRHHPPARRRLPIHPAMITASDITRGKPDPQPYLAGATVIALPSTYAQDELSGAETPSSRPEPPFRRRSGKPAVSSFVILSRRTRRTARVRSRRTCCCLSS